MSKNEKCWVITQEPNKDDIGPYGVRVEYNNIKKIHLQAKA